MSVTLKHTDYHTYLVFHFFENLRTKWKSKLFIFKFSLKNLLLTSNNYDDRTTGMRPIITV